MTAYKKILIGFVCAAFSLSVNAGIIFESNFDTEAGPAGSSALNYTGFTNWTVSDGTVDVVATSNPWGITCAGGTGKCVDLDGSTGDAGKLTSDMLSLAAGDYLLSFDISGNQRGGSDYMQMSLGGYVNETFNLNASAGWMTITHLFTVTSSSNDFVVFNQQISLKPESVPYAAFSQAKNKPFALFQKNANYLKVNANNG